jgi:hypothetical protein
MAGDDWQLGIWKIAINHVKVGAADRTGFHRNADLA